MQGASFRFANPGDGPNLTNANLNSLDVGLNVYAEGSVGLTVGVTAGRFVSAAAFVDYAGSTGNVLAGSTLAQTVYLTAAGALVIGALPASEHLPLAEVDTDALGVTEIRDLRPKLSTVGYTPTTLGDWTGVAPASIGDALDRLAAAVGPVA